MIISIQTEGDEDVDKVHIKSDRISNNDSNSDDCDGDDKDISLI